MKASPQLYIFEEYDLAVQQLSRTYLWSGMIVKENLGTDFDDIDEEKQKEVAAEMLLRDTVVATVVDPKFPESFYLIMITGEEKETTEDVEDGFRHVIKKEMKDLEGVFLERRFDSDNVYTIPKKPKFPFFFKKVWCSRQCSLSAKRDFELSHEELLMIIYGTIESNINFTNTIIVARIHVLNLVFLSLIFVFFLLPIHSRCNHFISSILPLGCYDLTLFSLHLDS